MNSEIVYCKALWKAAPPKNDHHRWLEFLDFHLAKGFTYGNSIS